VHLGDGQLGQVACGVQVRALASAFIICAVAALGTTPARANQNFAITCSSSQVRMDHGPFQVRFTITPSQAMRIDDVSVITPLNFRPRDPVPPIPPTLAAGSSFETAYVIDVPKNRFTESKQITHEIVFNIAYREGTDPGAQTMRQSLSLPFEVVQSRTEYILWSLSGVLIGAVIKLLGRPNSDPAAGSPPARADAPVRAQVPERRFLRVTRHRWMSVLTTLLVGFVVIMGLSKDKLPTKAYYDSIALGAAIGVLSDDKLLSRLGALPN
jgi:hypothetical protein